MKAEVGVFPALTLPARRLAPTLEPGEVVELPEYRGFWVCHLEDLPVASHVVLQFQVDEATFVLFEF